MSKDPRSATPTPDARADDTIRKPFPITMGNRVAQGGLDQDDAPTEVMERPSRDRLLAEQD